MPAPLNDVTATSCSPKYVPLSLSRVLCIAAAIRLAVCALAIYFSSGFEFAELPDTHTYVLPAKNLLAQGEFTRGAGPEIFRTPGYPLLLMPGIIAGQIAPVTIALQIALSVASVGLVYVISLQLFGRRNIATTAALLYACEPLSIIYCQFLLSETLFTLLILLFLNRLVSYLQQGETAPLVWSGLALCAATYVRPVSYFLPILMAGGLLLHAIIANAGKVRLRLAGQAVAYGLICMLLIGAWQVRNWSVSGYGGFSGISEHNLYFYHAAAIQAQLEHQRIEDKQIELGMNDSETFLQMHPQWRDANASARLRGIGQSARETILSHPVTYGRIYVANFGRLAINPGASDLMVLMSCFRHSSPLNATADYTVQSSHNRLWNSQWQYLVALVLLGGILGMLWWFAAMGVVTSIRTWSWPMWSVALVALYFYCVSVVPGSPGRLRHPIMPIVCILAAVGWQALRGYWMNRQASDRNTKRASRPISYQKNLTAS